MNSGTSLVDPRRDDVEKGSRNNSNSRASIDKDIRRSVAKPCYRIRYTEYFSLFFSIFITVQRTYEQAPDPVSTASVCFFLR
jgi:hypothetical protein